MACSGDSVLTSYEGSNDDSNNNGTSSPTQGQSFQITTNATICAFSFYGGRGTDGTQPGTYQVEIKSGGFYGTVLATTGSLSTSGMNLYTSPAWNKVEFTSPIALMAATTYTIVITSLTGSTNDVTRMYLDNTSASYSGGNFIKGGVDYPTYDLNFRIHGVNIPVGANANFLAFL